MLLAGRGVGPGSEEDLQTSQAESPLLGHPMKWGGMGEASEGPDSWPTDPRDGRGPASHLVPRIELGAGTGVVDSSHSEAIILATW